jgi:hypothetical protein
VNIYFTRKGNKIGKYLKRRLLPEGGKIRWKLYLKSSFILL